MKTLFITGASGFVGSYLLKKINLKNYKHVYCLSRTETNLLKNLREQENFTFIRGSIFDSDIYSPYLGCSDVVVHLAAITGKDRREEYFRVNTRGTEILIKQCENSALSNFLHVSSIAVKFFDKSHYYYAQSKEQGENAIRNSRLKYTIVRPTIIIGKEAEIWKSLSNLAEKPVIPIFGNGETKIQPIYIDDLVDYLLYVVNRNIFKNESFDLGGPEIITFEKFLKAIHHNYHNRDPFIIHLPLKPLVYIFALLENSLFSFLPFTAGQLSSFSNDGTTEQNWLLSNQLKKMKNVQEMISISINDHKEDLLKVNLNIECKKFCNYLIGYPPDDYIVKKYLHGHKHSKLFPYGNLRYLDAILLKIAKINPSLTKITDSYTRIFYSDATIRKKLLLLLAILECLEPYCSYLDAPNSKGKYSIYINMFGKGILFAATLFVSMIFLGSIHMTFVTFEMVFKKAS